MGNHANAIRGPKSQAPFGNHGRPGQGGYRQRADRKGFSCRLRKWAAVKIRPKKGCRHTVIDMKKEWAPLNHMEFEINRMKGIITQELFDLCALHDNCLDLLQLQAKPSKGVFCKEKIAKGKLVLTPASLRVNANAYKDKGELWEVNAGMENVTFWISSTVTLPDPNDDRAPVFLAPIWFVKASDKLHFNMEIAMIGIAGSKIKFPCLRNTKVLQLGEELLFCKMDKIKGSKKREVDGDQPVPKKETVKLS